MHRRLIITSIALLVAATTFTSVHAQADALETALFLLPDVTFEAIDPPEGFTASFELRVRQLIDHDDPERGTFLQRVFLNHRGFDRSTVLVTK